MEYMYTNDGYSIGNCSSHGFQTKVNTYDTYLNSKYDIEINQNALNNIKNNSQ